LEREAGKLKLHQVRGKLPAAQYHYSSGEVTKAEVRDALRGTFDLDREHVLIFYALCRREPDGRYVFDAPYYGDGSQRSGLCNAADCELLDPVLLRDAGRKIVYSEHYYPLVEESDKLEDVRAATQMAAEWLGVPFENIRFVQGDTDAVPIGRGSYGSRRMHGGGT